MRLRRLYIGLVAVLLGISLAVSNAQTSGESETPPGRVVYVIPVEGLISNIMLTSMQRRAEIAEEAGADLIVYEVDTYGGLVTSALEIGTFIKNQRVETLAWVNDKAISAGAMISVAADGIVMAERSRIGDSAPIAVGQQLEGVERAKIESPILEEFRDSARRNGYPLALSEAMVVLSPAIYQIRNTQTDEVRYVYSTDLQRYGLESPRGEYVPPQSSPRPRNDEQEPQSPFGMSVADVTVQLDENGDTNVQTDATPEQPVDDADQPEQQEQSAPADGEGEWEFYETDHAPGGLVNPPNTLVTLSQSEAVAFGFARQIIADDAELMALTGATPETFHRLEISWSEQLANLLVSPAVRSILMILLLLGAYLEFQSPGVGIPGAVALVALLLMIGAPFIAGLADMTSVLLIGAGFILLAVEVFLLPGIGIAGMLGVLAILAGFVMTFVPPDPEPGFLPSLPATWQGLNTGLMVLMIAFIVSGVLGYFLSKYIERVPLFRQLVLQSTVDMRHTGGQDLQQPTDEREPSTPSVASHPSPVAEGDKGVAMTGLRPAGRIEVDGQIVDVVTAGRWVEAGQPVRVVEVRGNRVVVEED